MSAAPDRRELASELLAINRKHAATFARIDDIKTVLRKIATDAGESFKEDFPGKGVVKVSAGRPGEFKGIMPEVVPATFLALGEAQREKLLAQGIIKMNPIHGRPYYGSVTIELF
jgi:hypothetical protein